MLDCRRLCLVHQQWGHPTPARHDFVDYLDIASYTRPGPHCSPGHTHNMLWGRGAFTYSVMRTTQHARWRGDSVILGGSLQADAIAMLLEVITWRDDQAGPMRVWASRTEEQASAIWALPLPSRFVLTQPRAFVTIPLHAHHTHI